MLLFPLEHSRRSFAVAPPPLPSGNASLQLKRGHLAEAAVFKAVLGNPRVNGRLVMDRDEYGPGPDSPMIYPPTLSLLEDWGSRDTSGFVQKNDPLCQTQGSEPLHRGLPPALTQVLPISGVAEELALGSEAALVLLPEWAGWTQCVGP